MNVIRPCPSCGLENPATADACGRCGALLSAFAATAPAPAFRSAPARGRGVLAVVLVLVAVGAVVSATLWWLSARGQQPVAPALQWDQPQAVAAWASEFLTHQDVPATEVKAEVSPSDAGPRHVLLSLHDAKQSLPLVMRAVARLLVAARADGPESAAHLAVVQRGDETWMLPVGEAADVASSPAALARLLGLREDELGLPETAAASEAAAAAESQAPPVSAPAATSAPPASAATPALGVPVPGSAPPSPGEALPAGLGAPAAPVPAPASSPSTASAPAEVSAIPARVSRGNGAVAPRVATGTPATLLRIQVAAGARRRLTLRSLTVRAKGTLAEVEDIAFLDLVRETDVSGRGATRPEHLGERMSFADDDGSVTFDGLLVTFGEDGLPLALTLVAELAPDVAGGQIELSLPDAASLVLEDSDGASVRVVGAPVRGPLVSVDGNLPPDPEQDRLDALADEGPDAVDPNVERMKQEAMDALRARASAPAPAPAGASAPQPSAPRPR